MWYIILFLIIIYILINYIQENFVSNRNKCSEPKKKTDNCFPFKAKWSICPEGTLNAGIKCCKCHWKRPGLNLKIDPECCRNKCNKINIKPTGIPYYCKQHQVCIKKYTKSLNDRFCGYYTLYNTAAKIYDTLDQCRNDVFKFSNLNKEQCLNTNGAGWCTDYLGEGICVTGTPVGPLDTIRYDTCFPNQITNRNSWIPGYRDPYLILRNANI